MTKKSWLSLVIGFSCLLTTMPSVAELVFTPCDGRVVSDLKFIINVDEKELLFDKDIFFAPPTFYVGQYLDIQLRESLYVCDHHELVDLWVALEIPLDGTRLRLFLVKSPHFPFFSFSLNPAPFKSDLESSDEKFSFLLMEVPPGMGGQYDFYAAYTKAGSNISELLFRLRSNLAAARVILAND